MLGRILVTVLAVLLSSKIASASAPYLISSPSSVKVNEEFSVNASMSGLSKDTIYRLRIAFANPGTHNYFGSTEDQGNWYNGTPSPIDYTRFKAITTDDQGNWQGVIKGKVELSDPNFKDKDKETQTLDFKIGRYTQKGNTATWSEIVSIVLINPFSLAVTPAPTRIPVAKPTPNQTPVSTQKVNAPTSTPFFIPQTSMQSPSSSGVPEEVTIFDDNILATTTILKVKEEKLTPTAKSPEKTILPTIFILLSFLFIFFSIGWLFKKKSNFQI